MKALKWIVIGLIACLGIGLGISYIITPYYTKQATDIAIGYLNTPLGIACGSTITIGTVVGVVVKLIYDRYKDRINNDIKQVKAYVELKEQSAKDYYEQALKQKEEVKTILESYSKEIDNLKDKLVELCKTSPNVKINALGDEINKGYDKLKEELTNELIRVDNEFKEVIKERVGYEELNKRIEELTKYYERLVSQYGREETINN